jgi:hypothetical protein
MQESNLTGQNIDSYCTKCRLNSEHTIMIMDAEKVSKVRCKTCGSTHRYKRPVEEGAGAVRKAGAKRGAGEAATSEMIWQAGLAKAKTKEREYSMTEQYRIGDIVNHGTFGKGIVLKVYVNKCGMLFKDGERLMASANQ